MIERRTLRELERGVTIQNTIFSVSGKMLPATWQVGVGDVFRDANPDQELTTNAVRTAMEKIRPAEEMGEGLHITASVDLAERLYNIVENLKAEAQPQNLTPSFEEGDYVVVSGLGTGIVVSVSKTTKGIFYEIKPDLEFPDESWPAVDEVRVAAAHLDIEDGADRTETLLREDENPQAAEQRFIGRLRDALTAGRVIRDEGTARCGALLSSTISGATPPCELPPGHDGPCSLGPAVGRPTRENSLALTKLEEAIMWAVQDAQRKNV